MKLKSFAFATFALALPLVACAAEAEVQEEAAQSEDAVVAAVPVAACLAYPPCAAAVAATVGVIANATTAAIEAAVKAWSKANPADATRIVELDPAKCSLTELNRRYANQKKLCDPLRSCKSMTSCVAIDRAARVASNCAYARRDVQLCFKKPDFDGHQTQINQVCTVYDGCDALYRHFDCNTGFIVRPAACGR